MENVKTKNIQPHIIIQPLEVRPVDTLFISFNIQIKHSGLESFRGAVADLAVKNLSPEMASLFHNHNNGEVAGGNSYLYRYPRIQYRVFKRIASLFAIAEGAEALDMLLRLKAFEKFMVRGNSFALNIIEKESERNFPLQLSEEHIPYRIHRYMALNKENYTLYKELDNPADKETLLERLLTNHLVGIARDLGWEWKGEKALDVKLRSISRFYKVNILGSDMLAFDLDFTTNAMLPDRMGMGRKTAFGYGWIYRLAH